MRSNHSQENWIKVKGILIFKTKNNEIYQAIQTEHKLGLINGQKLFCDPADSYVKTFSIFDIEFQRL